MVLDNAITWLLMPKSRSVEQPWAPADSHESFIFAIPKCLLVDEITFRAFVVRRVAASRTEAKVLIRTMVKGTPIRYIIHQPPGAEFRGGCTS
jgi:hypothetical protein